MLEFWKLKQLLVHRNWWRLYNEGERKFARKKTERETFLLSKSCLRMTCPPNSFTQPLFGTQLRNTYRRWALSQSTAKTHWDGDGWLFKAGINLFLLF
ncbi:hypothetical protein Peur_059740 [Populus x canadensis]